MLKFPQVLNLSVTNLRGKVNFFTQELGGSVEEVRDAIIGSPTLLGYSLTNRLSRRVQVLQSLGVQINFTDHVWLVSSATTLRFNRWVEKVLMHEVGAVHRGDAEVERRMKSCRAMLRGT